MTAYKTVASDEKKQAVKAFETLIKDYPIIGVVDVENLPALQLGRMRAQLRGTVYLLMSKKRLITIALTKESKNKPGLEKLIPHLKGMPALLFTKESPFKLYKTLKKNKSKAPIKAGQTAPNDIIVPAGATSFAPGPIIGELGSFGIKSGIEAGKVAIKEDKVVAKEGAVVNAKLAGILTRLGIEPMEIGLRLTALWENGQILTKDVLDIDEDQYVRDIQAAATQAFNLAVYAAIPNSQTISALLSKAHREAYALACEQNVMTEDTKELILAKAHAQAQALHAHIPQTTSGGDDTTSAPKGTDKEE